MRKYYSNYTGRQIDEAVGAIIENQIGLEDLSPELVATIQSWCSGGEGSQELVFRNRNEFPEQGDKLSLYIAVDEKKLYYWDNEYIALSSDISESIRAELDNKVDKVENKQLSSEDFTTELKNKLESLENPDLTNYYNKQEIDLNEIFGDVVATASIGGIAANTSLKDKTVKQVLEMLLKVQEPAASIVDQIIRDEIPAFAGTANTDISEVTYAHLDKDTANYTDQGFYQKIENDTVVDVGYQLRFDGNSVMDAQSFAIPSEAKIVKAYQYDEFGTQQWLEYEFPGSYWVEGDIVNQNVNGKELTYQQYLYNVDDVGDAITATEYWRFELEVNS